MRVHLQYKYLVAVVLLQVTAIWALPATRMDVFDKSGNALLFVEFDYDSTGKNTGRTIYASDSTFLRRTIFTNDNSGNRLKEHSVNFNDDTIGYTNFSVQNNRSVIDNFDQFGLTQFGTPVSYAQQGENEYEIYQSGIVIYKMKYSYTTDGILSKIDILDKNNERIYYAIFSAVSKIVHRNLIASYEPRLTVSENICKINVLLNKEALLKASIYNLSGKLVSVGFSKVMKAGRQAVQFKLDAQKPGIRASGLYIIRVSIDGKNILDSQTLRVW